MAEVSKGADAAVSAFNPGEGNSQKIVDATQALIAGLQQAGVTRFIEVGGAGSLFVAGTRVVDLPDFPAAYKKIALAHGDALDVLCTADLDWTYFSPAALIQPGERTGTFRLGKDDLIADSQGNSSISAEDYASALVDELENPQHIRERFTIGY